MSGPTGEEPDLELGTYGEGVMLLQVRLYALGIYPQVPDGTFDMVTETAVRELQSQLGQTNDGVVTRDTWAALFHQEQQAGIQYQYVSPYDALSQIRYDLEHPGEADGETLSEDGQWRWDGAQWLPVGGASGAAGQGGDGYAGVLSDDGRWQWDGAQWRPAGDDAAQTGNAGSGYTQGAGDTGATFSDDGQWRWDGTDWQPVDGAGAELSGYAGMLSDDGQWRWSGTQWERA